MFGIILSREGKELPRELGLSYLTYYLLEQELIEGWKDVEKKEPREEKE